MIYDENEKRLLDLKNTYNTLRDRKDGSNIEFLEGLVGYCKVIGFDHNKTIKMLGLILGRLPLPDESFTNMSIREYDKDEMEFLKKLDGTLKK